MKGKHKHSRCSHLYTYIHKFIGNREWAPTQQDNTTGGNTWIELFILSDTTAARSGAGDHVKDPEAAARAEKTKPNNNKLKIIHIYIYIYIY